MLQSVNRDNFQKEVLESSQLVFVNFWINWSEVCRAMRLLMKELDNQLNENRKLVEIDWESEKELAQKYEVYGVPSLLIFHQGQLVGRYSGMLDVEEFLDRMGGRQTPKPLV
ncbi:MAG: thioredoxin family protein [bacterium]